MTPGPGIELGTHWWKASAPTTAPTQNYMFLRVAIVFPKPRFPSCFRSHGNVKHRKQANGGCVGTTYQRNLVERETYLHSITLYKQVS